MIISANKMDCQLRQSILFDIFDVFIILNDGLELRIASLVFQTASQRKTPVVIARNEVTKQSVPCDSVRSNYPLISSSICRAFSVMSTDPASMPDMSSTEQPDMSKSPSSVLLHSISISA